MCDVLQLFFQDEPESGGWRRWLFYFALAVIVAIGVAAAIATGTLS